MDIWKASLAILTVSFVGLMAHHYPRLVAYLATADDPAPAIPSQHDVSYDANRNQVDTYVDSHGHTIIFRTKREGVEYESAN